MVRFWALDLQAGGLVDPLFVIEQAFEDLAGLLADGVRVFDTADKRPANVLHRGAVGTRRERRSVPHEL
ncbi:MAG TPA: hypothetical protein VFF64_22400 [Candidatus Eremiobacteraceae bacterium]|nr:hypothetical protein [Candidatus Eremiobacteraceae bacterium]